MIHKVIDIITINNFEVKKLSNKNPPADLVNFCIISCYIEGQGALFHVVLIL